VSSLRHRIVARSQRAADRGALVTIPTTTRTVIDGGIPFIVHVSALQESKARAEAEPGRRSNPFLPPDPDLFIDELPPDHLGVLNKFNVLRHHLLIVTRRFEAQEEPLNQRDLAALAICMNQVDGLGFYNGGRVAGASQAHKHLQLVPVPLGDRPDPTPLDAVIRGNRVAGDPGTIDELGFRHVLIPLAGGHLTGDRAEELLDHYRSACRALELDAPGRPYNLLLTRRWMLVVPRSREFWRGVSVNALGFAGSLLVRNDEELSELEALGPLEVLRHVVEEGT
jgi:ATP adenylyltransferase